MSGRRSTAERAEPSPPRPGPRPRGGPGRGPETRERLLDAAERLFGAQGYASTSLREITAEAGANLAAVNYHFGGKEALLGAVLSRRVEPVNRRRLARLDELEAAAGDAPVEVRELLRTFVGAPLREFGHLGAEGRHVLRLIGRCRVDPSPPVRGLLRQQFGEVLRRFVAALTRAMPEVPEDQLLWRMMAVAGVFTFFLSELDAGDEALAGRPAADVETTIERIVAFALPGLQGPPSA